MEKSFIFGLRLSNVITMKVKYLIILLLSSVFGLFAQNNKRLVGKWELVEFTLKQGKQTAVSDEKTLRDAGAIWFIDFYADGNFEQSFNMRRTDMAMETQTGKWQTKNDSLFVELQIDTITSKLNYGYVLFGDVVVFTLENPVTYDKVITRFRRK